jgi:hypothetical protein
METKEFEKGATTIMKTVTVKQFMGFNPCYDEAEIKKIAGDKKNWTALDVLALKNVSVQDRLWAVLREEFIDAPILHEFACRCAENALALVKNPDPRSVAAIEAKRKWLKGEASDSKLLAARNAAGAAARAARDAASVVARAAARAARDAASVVARDAAGAASWDAASAVASAASRDASRVAWDAAGDAQINLLFDMINREKSMKKERREKE